MKRSTKWSAVMLAAMLPLAAQAGELAVSGDAGVVSQYLWRGVPQTACTAAQGDLKIAGNGLTGAAWYSNAYASPAPQKAGRSVVEFDWSLDYSGSVGDVGYSAGGILYSYLNDSASNFGEIYLGASYAAAVTPGVKLYYNVASSKNKAYLAGDVWVDLSLAGSVADFAVAGTLSLTNWKKDATNRPVVGGVDKFKSGLSLGTLAVSRTVSLEKVNLTPSFTFSQPVGSKASDGERYLYGVPVKSEVVVGMNLAY